MRWARDLCPTGRDKRGQAIERLDPVRHVGAWLYGSATRTRTELTMGQLFSVLRMSAAPTAPRSLVATEGNRTESSARLTYCSPRPANSIPTVAGLLDGKCALHVGMVFAVKWVGARCGGCGECRYAAAA